MWIWWKPTLASLLVMSFLWILVKNLEPWKDGSSDYVFVCWRRWQQWHVCQIDGGASMGKPYNYKGDIIKLG
jgi:hypothetical protein